MSKKQNIPIDIDKTQYLRLKNLAERNNKSIEEIMEEFREARKEASNDYIAVNIVMNKYRKQKQFQERAEQFKSKAKAERLIGFLVGDMGLIDKAEQIRQKARRYIEQHGVQAAIEANLIDGDGNILDTRETIYGRENPKYLEPLDPNLHLRSRTLIGYFRRQNGNYKYTTIHTEDNALAKGWNAVKFFIPCETYGIVKEETDEEMKVNSSLSKETMTVFKPVKEEIDVDTILNKVKKTPINMIEQLYEQTKEAWDRYVIVEGIVAWINIDRPTSYGSTWMGLMDEQDEEQMIRCLIPEHLSIDFGENSKILVFGRTRRYKTRDENGDLVDADVIIDVHGIYPYPNFSTPPKTTSTVNSQEEELEIEGWIE